VPIQDPANLVLHTGVPIPRRLIEAVTRWDQAEITPGWLESLPGMVAELCAEWEIELEPVVPESYVTLVLLGRSTALGPVVIKSSPLAEEFRAETAALQLAAGERVARVYDVDFARSVMVQERIVPGTQLRDAEMSDDDATRLAAELVTGFWWPVESPAELHPLRRWMRALFAWPLDSQRIPRDLIEHAQQIAESLLASSRRSVLLHGDFQHHNVLRRANGDWVIIDPKGVYGDPGFEIAAWMYNPPGVTEREDYLDIAKRRIEIWSAVTGLPRAELTAWAFVGAVLSTCWSAAEPAPEDWLFSFGRGARELRKLL
jgi:streptomycin 6-kinase